MKVSRVLLALVLVLTLGCGLIDGIQIPCGPCNPSPSPTATVTPVPSPSPSPSSEPTPTPEPTPEPTATPIPPTVPLCNLPPTDGLGKCQQDDPDLVPHFDAVVKLAQLKAEKDGFVLDGKILNEVEYTNAVAGNIVAQGYCAINGRKGGHTSDDEVWIKDTNGFSEHFDIVAGPEGGKYAWIKYVSRCAPAKF